MWLVELDRSAAARSVEFEPSEPAKQTRRRLSRGVSCRPVVTQGIIISCTPLFLLLHTVRMVSNGFSNLQYRGSGTEARRVHDSLALRTQQSAERFARSPVSPRHRRHREPRRIGCRDEESHYKPLRWPTLTVPCSAVSHFRQRVRRHRLRQRQIVVQASRYFFQGGHRSGGSPEVFVAIRTPTSRSHATTGTSSAAVAGSNCQALSRCR